MYKRLFPSIEGFRQLPTDFYKALIDTINELHEAQPRVFKWSDYEATRLKNVISKYTDCTCEVQFSTDTTAFQNIQIREQIHFQLKNPKEIASGGVDLNTGKLLGGFKKIVSRFFFQYHLFNEPFTAEEAAAIILHEVGHMVTFYYMATKYFILSNWALKDISDGYNNNADINKRRLLLTQLKDKTKKEWLDIEKLLKAKDETTLISMLLLDVQQEVTSDLGTPEYNMVGYEFLADQYATKCGAGRALITGLDRLGDRRKKSQGFYYQLEIMPLTIVLGTAFFSFIAAGLLVAAWAYAYDPRDRRQKYNSPEDRITRIRLQMVARLNSKELSKEARELARAELEELDKTIAITKNKFFMMERLWGVLSSFLRKRGSAEELQMQLERLALNELYVKAYDLRTLEKTL